MEATIETIVLAKMLTSINSLNLSIERLNSEDFQEPINRSIFLAAKQLYNENHVVEVDSVIDMIKKIDPKNLDIAYIYGLSIQAACVSDDIFYYIENVKERSRKNSLLTLSVKIAQSHKDDKDFHEVYHEVISYLDNQIYDSKLTKIKTIKDILSEDYRQEGQSYLDFFKIKYSEHKMGFSSLSGIPTFIPSLDEMLDGLNHGHFIIIAARPGVGKTSFAIQIIKNLIEKSISVGFFSLEMTALEVINKIISNQLRIDYRRISKAQLTEAEHESVLSYYQNKLNVNYQNLYIDDQESPTIDQLCSRAKRMKDVHGIQVLFIDYLTLIRGGKKFSNRQEEIQYISSSLRALAKKLKIPVVCVAQLNRESEAASRIPKKSDLRESGQIEQDAHTIIMLHKPNQTDAASNTPESKQESNAFLFPGRTTAYIVKNRFGEEGFIHFETNLAYSYYKEINYAKEVKQAINDKENW